MSNAPDTCLIVECTSFAEAQDKLNPLQGTALTLLLPPNIAGPVPSLFRELYPLWHIGMLGWEGTRNECLAWTSEQAIFKILVALKMGYENIFRPPNGVYDPELVRALVEHGKTYVPPVVINNPGSKPCAPELKFFPGGSGQACQIVNASAEIVNLTGVTYVYPDQHAVAGDPYETE